MMDIRFVPFGFHFMPVSVFIRFAKLFKCVQAKSVLIYNDEC